MRVFAILALLGGLLATIALVLMHGAAAIWHSAAIIGVSGAVLLLTWRLAVFTGMGLSWWVLGRHRTDARLWRYVWGRLLRDSGGDVLPLSQIGGFVIGARALTLAGVDGGFAAASTVVDVTLELIGQLAYVLLGLGLLQALRPKTDIVVPVLAAVLGMGVLVAIFAAVQARGAGLAEKAVRRMAALYLGEKIAREAGVQRAVTELHQRHLALFLCGAGHFLWWIMSGLETWITFRLMGLHVGVAAALVVDSFLYGVRSIAFVVPSAYGVQEGALMVLAGFFGVGAAPALALSLIKRARDLVIGVPALLAWQYLEGKAALRGKAKASSFSEEKEAKRLLLPADAAEVVHNGQN